MINTTMNQSYQSQGKEWTFNEVLGKFEAIEEDLRLDESLINGVPWWDSVRYSLFQDILRELQLLETAVTNSKKSTPHKKLINSLKKIFWVFKLFSPHSPLWVVNGSIMIWGHSRRKFDNGLYVDIYSDPFVELLPDNARIAVLEIAEINGHLSPVPTQNLFYAERLFTIGTILSSIKRLFVKVRVDQSVVVTLEKQISLNFQINFDMKKRVIQSILNWDCLYQVMYLFFRLKKPSHLFLVGSACREAIVAAAKAAVVPTFELQHGSPARGKLNYDYSSGIKKRSFPDYFLSFGDYWTNKLTFPLPTEKIINFGYPYLAKKVDHYSTVQKENTMLIISQTVHAKRLASFAIHALEVNQGIDVIFKPHPSEFLVPEPEYFRTLRESGVIVAEKDSDLYYLFSRAKWHVGVYSTALYEGLCFDSALYLLPLPGFECMKPLIRLGLAKVIVKDQDFDKNWVSRSDDLCKIFAKPSREKLESILSLT